MSLLIDLSYTSHSRARLIANDDKTSISQVTTPKPAANGTASDKVVIDPSKGGAVSPKASRQSQALNVKPGSWVWDGVVKILEVDLFSAAWEVRHGAAMALRELLKAQGKYGGMRGLYILSVFIRAYISLTFDQMTYRTETTILLMNDGVMI